MAFVDYEYFSSLYGADSVDAVAFSRFSYDAEKVVKSATTGVDNICKLTVAFPTIAEDVESVKRCICALVDMMNRIETANKTAEDGKVISSVKAGNESITYSVGSGTIASALSDAGTRRKLYADIVEQYLGGVVDNNGVNLLYTGVYPYLVD